MIPTSPQPEDIGSHLHPVAHDYVSEWLQSETFRANHVTGHKARSNPSVAAGVNAIMSRFLGGGSGEQGNAFLLCDAHDESRTNQILLTAHLMAEKTNTFSLLVTFYEDVPRLRSALRHFGLSPDQQQRIRIHSYADLDQLSEKAYARDWEFGVAIFNEAHSLIHERQASTQTIAGLSTRHQLYITSTPFVDEEGTLFFLSQLRDRSPSEVFSELVPLRKEWMHHGLFSNIEAACEHLLWSGAMRRREARFWGDIKLAHCQLNKPELHEQKEILDYFDAQFRGNPSDAEKTRLHRQRVGELVHLTHRAKIEEVLRLTQQELAEGRKVVITGVDWKVWYQSEQGKVSVGFLNNLIKALRKEDISFGQLEKYEGPPHTDAAKFHRQKNYHAVYSFLQQPDSEYARRFGLEPKDFSDVLVIPSSFTNISQRLYHEEGQEGERSFINAGMMRAGSMLRTAQMLSHPKATSPSRYFPVVCDNSFADEVMLLTQTMTDFQYLKATGSSLAHQFEAVVAEGLINNRYLQGLELEIRAGNRPSVDHWTRALLDTYCDPRPRKAANYAR